VLSIIIVSFNTKKLLQNCLKSVFSQTKGIDFEVIVVDNASKDGSAAMVKKEFPRAKLIQNQRNLGFAKANNKGIKQAKGEWLLLLNSDTKIINNALAKLVNFAQKQPGLGIAGPRLLNVDHSPQLSTAPFYTLPITAISLFKGDRWLRQSPEKIKKVDWVSGACFLIKKQVIQKIGFLDEKFFMYVEEMEYCYRAKKNGFLTFFYPGSEVLHFERGSSVDGKEKAILSIYKGLIFFYKKHFACWQVSVLKFLLQTKAGLAWLLGFFTNNQYLKTTYAKAFKMAR